MYYKIMETPLGTLTIISDDTHLKSIHFGVKKGDFIEVSEHPILDLTIEQLTKYFDGKLKTFDLPLSPEGTPFQKVVWNALEKIPYGETLSYGDVAVMIGNPKSVRAVGQANNKNPIPIIIPCHRVLGKDGSLVGYAGGLETKKFLLYLEGSLNNEALKDKLIAL